MNQLTEFLCHPPVVHDWSAGSWNRFLPLVRGSRLTGRCLAHLEQHELMDAVPPRILDHLRGGAVQARYVRGQAIREWRQVEPILARAGIQVMPLKGLAYLLQQLPPSHWRGLSDIDILVRHADVTRAQRLLEASGWAPSGEFDDYDRHYYAAWMHEVPPMMHPRRSVEVDLHHNLAPPVSRIKIDADALWAEAKEIEGRDGERLLTLSPTDLLLHNAVHLFMNDELRGGLRDVVDFRDLYQHFVSADGAFPDRLVERADVLGCGRPLFYAVHTAKRLAGLRLDDGIERAVARYAPAGPVAAAMFRLIDDLLAPSSPVSRRAAVAERLLFIRSHWIRMPPLMLARHLAHKWLKPSRPAPADEQLPG